MGLKFSGIIIHQVQQQQLPWVSTKYCNKHFTGSDQLIPNMLLFAVTKMYSIFLAGKRRRRPNAAREEESSITDVSFVVEKLSEHVIINTIFYSCGR